MGVLLAEQSEAGRLRRGRDYAKQGAVGPLTVAPGMVSAVVQGSRPEPYVASARVHLTEATGGRMASLVPSKREVRYSCTCPDDDLPCKHAVAVMTAFTEQLAANGALFIRWRTGGEAALDDHTANFIAGTPAADRAARIARTAHAAATKPVVLADEARAALATFLGDDREHPEPAPPPELDELEPTDGTWDEVWSEMLSAAIETMQRPRGLGRRR